MFVCLVDFAAINLSSDGDGEIGQHGDAQFEAATVGVDQILAGKREDGRMCLLHAYTRLVDGAQRSRASRCTFDARRHGHTTSAGASGGASVHILNFL